MDSIKIGRTIKILRSKLGYTQKDIAEQLNVTDKAVSKWERGISTPDISIITKLSNLLNVDVDNILNGNVSFLNGSWVGYIDIKDSDSSIINLSTIVYNKPLVYVYFSYFLLAGIKTIIINCSEFEKNIISKFLDGEKEVDLDIIFSDYSNSGIKNKNVMMICDNCFLYGVNLTKYFNRAMSKNDGITFLACPKKKTIHKQRRVCFGRSKQLTDRHLYDNNKYYLDPIVFINKNYVDNLDECFNYYELEVLTSVYIEPMGNGMIEFLLEDYLDINMVSNLISIIENGIGSQIYDVCDIYIKRFLN